MLLWAKMKEDLLNDHSLLDVKEAAEILRVPTSTVYGWVRTGRLPCYRIGPRAIRFSRPLLEAWWEEQLQGQPVAR
jgi:excisionase family DNA binding protein